MLPLPSPSPSHLLPSLRRPSPLCGPSWAPAAHGAYTWAQLANVLLQLRVRGDNLDGEELTRPLPCPLTRDVCELLDGLWMEFSRRLRREVVKCIIRGVWEAVKGKHMQELVIEVV